MLRIAILSLLLTLLTSGCAPARGWLADSGVLPPEPYLGEAPDSCPVTQPVWYKPSPDPAVSGTPEYGFYYLNPEGSMWATAWWAESRDQPLQAGEEGVKVGWSRPEGVDLVITGERLDGEAPQLLAEVPCCYPTRFQASGLYFPTAGCWQVDAQAAESSLSFVVWVAP